MMIALHEPTDTTTKQHYRTANVEHVPRDERHETGPVNTIASPARTDLRRSRIYRPHDLIHVQMATIYSSTYASPETRLD